MQGERRGMGSELRDPDPIEKSLATILYPESIWAQPIAIQQSVGLSDVSFWQESIDFGIMRRAGLAGVIIRAGQRNWEDLKFKTNWQAAKTAGVPRGSYWFYDSRDTPANQARLWASLLGSDRGELFHACDFEESYGGAYGERGHFKEFINRFQDATGLPDDRIVNYTGYYWWLARVGDDIFFRRFGLWLAWYAAASVVKVPPPWHESELLLWQYTSSGDGTAYGVSSKEIDLNWYAHDLAHYKQRFSLGIEEPPTGEPMIENKYFKVTTATLNIRSSPAVLTTNDIGDLRLGDIVHAQEERLAGTITWHKVEPKVYRGGVWLNFATPGAENWCAEKQGTTVYMLEVGDPAPPTEPPTIILKHTIKIYNNGSYSVDDGPIVA
jgi:GH25 family lysozyme M1 (1,4-beta-N-acetylmuramidase)